MRAQPNTNPVNDISWLLKSVDNEDKPGKFGWTKQTVTGTAQPSRVPLNSGARPSTKPMVPNEVHESDYDLPEERESGNVVFRQDPDGGINISYARDRVLEAMSKLESHTATNRDKAVIVAAFPHLKSAPQIKGYDKDVADGIKLDKDERQELVTSLFALSSQAMAYATSLARGCTM